MNYEPATVPQAQATPWLDAVACGLVLCDANLTVQHANQRCGEMLGLAAPAMQGRHLLNLLELPERHATQALHALERSQPWQGLSRSGERALKIELRTTSHGVVASLIDYSADLEHLQRLNDAKTMAEKSNEAKSQFLQHMSHELRTPLNAIIGFTQLLKISQTADERELDNIAEIEKAGASLLALINEILDLSKIEAGKLKLSEAHVDLRALAEECLQLVAPMAALRGIGIEVRVAPGLLLLADYVRLKQILLNLLSNAVKYNRDGGTVSVHGFASDAQRLRIEIRDSGIGIAPEHLQTIFSPFDRLGSIEGSGIGLMITRRLVALMQGQVGVFSLPARGSVFWVELPRMRLSVLESMLQQGEDLEHARHDCGPLFWIGARTALYEALESLRELRPALRLRHYATVAEAHAALPLERPGLVLLGAELASATESEPLVKQLKQSMLHVVTDNTRGCRGPDVSAQAATICEDAGLTALLALLDSYMTGSDEP